MKKIKGIVDSMFYNELLEKVSSLYSVTITEARSIISKLSFSDYSKLLEAGTTITPPSGNTIGPTSNNQPEGTGTNTPTTSTSNIKSIWPGKGVPVEVGMTVGLTGPNNLPVPGQVTQVDQSAKGVKVKNPTTGQDEWMNLDTLQPFVAQAKPDTTQQPGNTENQPTTESSDELARLKELAGIRENCSAGATSAGAIAVAPTAMGTVKRRSPAEESLKKEYTRDTPAKSIVGDTKPNQASGELSANLAASGKRTARRPNIGSKK